jgi:hypothetical protein
MAVRLRLGIVGARLVMFAATPCRWRLPEGLAAVI